MNDLDDITRKHLQTIADTNKVIALAFVIGVIIGIVAASILHKFIVHPLGW